VFLITSPRLYKMIYRGIVTPVRTGDCWVYEPSLDGSYSRRIPYWELHE
jgi:hypothetical protein